jgi:hypothetical protein
MPAVLAAVLALVLALMMPSAAMASAAGTRSGAAHPGMIFAVGSSQPVSAGEGRGGAAPQAEVAAGACVAAEDAGAASRTVVLGRNMADRVIPYAEKNGFDFYKGTPNWVPRSLIERISPSALEKTDLWFNQRWIQGRDERWICDR